MKKLQISSQQGYNEHLSDRDLGINIKPRLLPVSEVKYVVRVRALGGRGGGGGVGRCPLVASAGTSVPLSLGSSAELWELSDHRDGGEACAVSNMQVTRC